MRPVSLNFGCFLLFIFFTVASALDAQSQGILILNGSDGTYFPIVKSEITLDVIDQVGKVSCSQTFYNNLGVDTVAEYAFALPEEGAALRIDYQVDGVWYQAVFSGAAQDTILPGEDSTGVADPTAAHITDFLGETPIYFEFGLPIPAGSYATFRTEYVELLDYGFNHAYHHIPGNYAVLGLSTIDTMQYDASIVSQRSMIGVELAGQNLLAVGNLVNPSQGTLSYSQLGFDTQEELILDYEMENANFGLIDFSTLLPDSVNKCDSLGNGFVGLIIEPEGVETQVVDKDFILIIDESGSMSGSKIADAKEAAHYVLDNLNPNDRFNIVSFDNTSSAYSTNLQMASPVNVINGHGYIDNIDAGGGTNISSSFDMSVPMFTTSPAQNAKVIVFLTDGQATAGVTSTSGLVSHVNALVAGVGLGYDFSLYCFGVDGANQQLLNQLSDQNNGEAYYITAGSLSSVMSNFYNTIQNPVVLNTQLSFDPPLVSDLYPAQLPNLYLGQQLVVFGRYDLAGTTNVTLSGVNYGIPVSYTYSLELADTLQNEYAFLPKMWTKKYIDYQMSQYYAQADLYSAEADSIKGLVITSSLCSGVLSPFTSFQQDPDGGNGGGLSEVNEQEQTNELLVFPNPFLDNLTLNLERFQGVDVIIQVYGVLGELIFETSSLGNTQVVWTGNTINGQSLSKGVYFIKIIADGQVMTARVEKL